MGSGRAIVKTVLVRLLVVSAFGALVVFLGATLDRATFRRVASLLPIPLVLLAVVMVLRTWRRERPFPRWAQVLALVTPALSFGFYLLLYMKQAGEWRPWIVGLTVAGVLLGHQWSRATRLSLKGGEVVGRNTGAWLVFWFLSFAVTQAMVIWGRRTGLNLSLLVFALSSGTATGMALGLLKRISAVHRAAAAGLVCLLAGGAALAADQMFEETFDERLSSAKWRLPRTDGQLPGRWRVRGGSLILSELPGGWDGRDHFTARDLAFEAAGDLTATTRLHDIRTRPRIVTGEKDVLGKVKPQYEAEGHSEIALELGSGFSLGIQCGHYEPHRDRHTAPEEHEERIRAHPFAVVAAWKIRGRDDWVKKRAFLDLPDETSELVLRMEKRGKTWRWLANGRLVHETAETVTPKRFRPSLFVGQLSGPILTAKVDYLNVVGGGLRGAAGDPVARRVPGGRRRASSPEDIPREAEAAAVAAGLIGTLGTLLLLLSQLGQRGTAAPAPAPTREPPAPVDPTPRAPPEAELARVKAKGDACWQRTAGLRTSGEGAMEALDDHADECAAQAERIRGEMQEHGVKLYELQQDLETKTTQLDADVRHAARTRDELYGRIRAEYPEIGSFGFDDLEAAVRSGDPERVAEAEAGQRTAFEGALDLARILDDTGGRSDLKAEQLEKLLGGGYASVAKRVREGCRALVDARADRDRELGRIRRELSRTQAQFDDAGAAVANFEDAGRGAVRRLGGVRRPFEHLDRLTGIRRNHAKAVSSLKRYLAEADPRSRSYDRTVRRLLADASRAADELCAGAEEALESVRVEEAPRIAEAKAGEPYPGYADDLDFLENDRETWHRERQGLTSYLRNHPRGSPFFDPEKVEDMEHRIRQARAGVRDQERRIRREGGTVPPDGGPDGFRDPYSGVGREAGLEWRKLEAEKAWQDHLAGKVSEFMDRHPEYHRVRDNLYRPDGTMDLEKLGKLRQHHMRETFASGHPTLEELESEPGWLATGAYLTAREYFTGIDRNGESTWRSFAINMLFRVSAGVASGGGSEFVGMPVDALFRMKHAIDHGRTGFEALRDSLNGALFDHFVGEAMGWGMRKAGGALAGFGRSAADYVDGTWKRLRTTLHGVEPLPLDHALGRKKASMLKALASGDEKSVLALYEQGGMKDLGHLEAMGHIDVDQAAKLNAVLKKNGQASILTGTKDAVGRFADQTGVRVKKLTMGDSGSRPTGTVRQSVQTDFDRTLVVDFHEADLARYAKEMNSDVKSARLKLSEYFQKVHEQSVDTSLRSKGLTGGDVGYASYNGIGSAAGHADSYSKAYTYFRQAKGSGLEFRIDADGNVMLRPDGSVHSYETGGQAVIDANEMVSGRVGPLDLDPMRYSFSDWESVISQQKMAASHYSDVKHLAKALDRAAEAATKMGRGLGEPGLERIATACRNEPDRALEILTQTGLSEEVFVRRARDLLLDYSIPTVGT